jgi:hypothetical protein
VSPRRWTADEADLAVTYLPYWRVETIARALGRTPAAVRSWCARHGQWPTTQHLVTSGWAAQLTGLTPQRLTALARAGAVPARRVPGGRWWLFDPERLPRRRRGG